jgi:cytidylate kinase
MILKDAGIDTMSIYLHAPMDKRLKRAIEIREEGEEPTAKLVEDHDKKRRTFYKQYTGSELYDASNYTFCFDVGKISIPQCADIILGAL